MEKPVIEVKNIGKKYKIVHGRGKYIALRDVIANIAKRPFAFLKHKAKVAAGIEKKEEFWALRGVDFKINKGEVVGIIGHNGAGKSTLLKILSQITPPTEGEIILRGKVGSLLEVGTGFHPELTGRENIFLNGAILGMRKREIVQKFDQIVEFAGIEKFLDTPVKYYSSGMYVRLAFSVAAHMEPDILLVDEVLAVGDAEFQKKCLGKMKEVTTTEGRTILFVSHNMAAIQNLCKRSILLEKGRVVAAGDTRDVIGQYVSKHMNQLAINEFPEQKDKAAYIKKISILDKKNSPRTEFSIGDHVSIEVDFVCKKPIADSILSLLIYSQDRDLLLYSSESDISGTLSEYAPGTYRARIDIPQPLFNVGRYSFDVLFHTPNITTHALVQDLVFEIKNIDNPRSIVFQGNHVGKMAIPLKFNIKKI